MCCCVRCFGLFLIFSFFFFNDTATTEIYTLSLHDALPISSASQRAERARCRRRAVAARPAGRRKRVVVALRRGRRSEEHTSELQSQSNLVCRLLLEKKKQKNTDSHTTSTQAASTHRTSRHT